MLPSVDLRLPLFICDCLVFDASSVAGSDETIGYGQEIRMRMLNCNFASTPGIINGIPAKNTLDVVYGVTKLVEVPGLQIFLVFVNPFRAPSPLPILNPSNFVPKTDFQW